VAANGIRVLERALDVLNFMAEDGKPVRVSAVAEATGLSPATAYRILSTLRERNVVLQDENSFYMIGPTPLFWGSAYRAQRALSQAFRAHAAELREMSRETVHLFSFERNRIYYVDKLDSPQTVTMRSRIGAWRDLYSTSGGRAVLAALPEAERLKYLNETPLTAHNPRTQTDKNVLLSLLAEGKDRGYQEEADENEAGIRCVGAPILNADGYPLGAISVSAPSYRVDDAFAARIGRQVKIAADKITAALSHK
jgi:DNA-binding IclR family transcriptional regulator